MREVKKPEVRKAEIVDAALALFADNGYEKTTVEAVTNRLGVAKGCFYHHFRSKEHVFTACVDALADRLATTFLAMLEDTSTSPAARLVAYIDHNYGLAARNAGGNLYETLHSGGFQSLHDRVTENVVERLLPAMTTLVTAGVAAGEFDVLDPEFTAVAVLGALSRLHAVYAHRPDLDLAEHRAHLFDLLDRMLGTRLPELERSPV